MRAVLPPVLDTLDYAWHRVTARMAGMSAAECSWEPVAGAWSVRTSPGGTVRADDITPVPAPPPVTTIAWRTWHIGADCLAGYTIGGLGPWPLEMPRQQWYLDPADALAAINTSWQAFRAGLVQLGEDAMTATGSGLGAVRARHLVRSGAASPRRDRPPRRRERAAA